MQQPAITLIDGVASQCVPLDDRGLYYGDGIFETMAIVNGNIPLWSYHLQRVVSGCDRLLLMQPEVSVLETELSRLTAAVQRGVIKLMITRRADGRGYAVTPGQTSRRIMQRFLWPDPVLSHWTEGVRLRWCQLVLSTQPVLAGIKHLNRLEQVMARAEWQGDEFDEGLLCDSAGNVIEAIAHNVFIVEAGRLLTPNLQHCGVAGVMRQFILEQAPAWGIATEIATLSRERCLQAEEVFLCNSLHGIWPVRRIAAQPLQVGALTRKLSQKVQEWLPII